MGKKKHKGFRVKRQGLTERLGTCDIRSPMRKGKDELTRRRIAAHLRRIMQDRKWNQSELGRRLGLSSPGMFKVLSEDRTPGLDVVLKIRRRLRIPYEEILETDPPERFFTVTTSRVETLATAAEDSANLMEAALNEEGVPDRARRLIAEALQALGRGPGSEDF